MGKKDTQNQQSTVGNNPSTMPSGMSGMPYPISGMPYVIKVQQKKMSTATFAAISVSIVIVVAILAVVFILLFAGNDEGERDGYVPQVTQKDEDDVVLPSYEEYLIL